MVVAAELEETLDLLNKKVTWKDIAVAVKLSPSSLTNLRNGTEMKFPTLLEIAKFVYQSDYITRFKRWCLSFESPKNICYALEYLAVNRQIAELDELINKIKDHRADKKMQEWAEGYSILSRYLKRENPIEVVSSLRQFFPKCVEMQVLSQIIEVWCRYKLSDFITMDSLIKGMDHSINKIREEFIRQSYSIRLKEALAYVNLYKFNNVEKTRMYAEEIFSSNTSATFTTSASYLVGMSFLFDNYEKCLGYIERHRELLVESGRIEEIAIIDNCDIPFIKNIWKKHNERPKTDDISEVAHYEAVMGDKELAVELIDKAVCEQGNSGFKYYYKALATNDPFLFMQALIEFNKNGDKFYANLPYQHLKSNSLFKPMADQAMGN